MPTPTTRTSAVKIMLHPDMHAKLRALAATLGQTPSTLASLAVSQYVAQQTANLGATQMAITQMIDKLGPEFAEQMRLLDAADKA